MRILWDLKDRCGGCNNRCTLRGVPQCRAKAIFQVKSQHTKVFFLKNQGHHPKELIQPKLQTFVNIADSKVLTATDVARRTTLSERLTGSIYQC
jgi:ribonucleotide monophosphatase NagD (HAD superfamily)